MKSNAKTQAIAQSTQLNTNSVWLSVFGSVGALAAFAWFIVTNGSALNSTALPLACLVGAVMVRLVEMTVVSAVSGRR